MTTFFLGVLVFTAAVSAALIYVLIRNLNRFSKLMNR